MEKIHQISVVLLFSFLFMTSSYTQTEIRYKYDSLSNSEWIEKSVKLKVYDEIEEDIINIKIVPDSGLVALFPTNYFPSKKKCLYGQKEISDQYAFSTPIVKYMPEVIDDQEKDIKITFQVKRERIILDYTGIFAIRHLFPKTETIVYINK